MRLAVTRFPPKSLRHRHGHSTHSYLTEWRVLITHADPCYLLSVTAAPPASSLISSRVYTYSHPPTDCARTRILILPNYVSSDKIQSLFTPQLDFRARTRRDGCVRLVKTCQKVWWKLFCSPPPPYQSLPPTQNTCLNDWELPPEVVVNPPFPLAATHTEDMLENLGKCGNYLEKWFCLYSLRVGLSKPSSGIACS